MSVETTGWRRRNGRVASVSRWGDDRAVNTGLFLLGVALGALVPVVVRRRGFAKGLQGLLPDRVQLVEREEPAVDRRLQL
jgi:hypothetical protein